MTDHRKAWQQLLTELETREAKASAMGGEQRIAKQHARGRQTARERIEALCDAGSFSEYGMHAGGNHPSGSEAVPADALVGGVGRIDGQPVVVLAEDFTVKGGSIGHANAAKRARLVRLAEEQGHALLLLLDGAGERSDNQLERYPNSPSDLQLLADLKGAVPIVTLVLGTSAGHGALTGMFADLIIMLRGAAMFTAGPPLVEAALGLQCTPEELGGADMHTAQSGVAHNLVDSEQQAFDLARAYLAMLANDMPDADEAKPRDSEALLDIIPPQVNVAYDMRAAVEELADRDSFIDLQPDYGRSMLCGLARIGGRACMLVANQPAVQAGAITREAAEKATHFITVANDRSLPLVLLVDNPGVMPGPEAERSGVLRAAADMFLAQRRFRGKKIAVTLRKGFGFGSSVMGMNPWDRQSVNIALPCVSLGGLPAISGSLASKADDATRESVVAAQGGAWVPADAMAFDKVVSPAALRGELIDALGRT